MSASDAARTALAAATGPDGDQGSRLLHDAVLDVPPGGTTPARGTDPASTGDPSGPGQVAPAGPASPSAAGTTGRAGSRRAGAAWRTVWPKLAAVALFVLTWQLVAWSAWRPAYVLPGPEAVLSKLGGLAGTATFWSALSTTGLRALAGFAVAVAVGTGLGLAVARFAVLRAAVGSLLTGLQTMPSITWFPLAILLFQLSEQAIAFVVVLGAAPSIANGIISGIDHVPPSFTRLGTVLGARGWNLYRLIVVPAALPAYVAGLNQGWAFAWRSLMAGELLVVIASRPSLGSRLAFAQEFGDSASLIAYMLVILVTGMAADALFSTASRHLRRRRGLAD
ncbi:MAG TPA: ABC transporter permease [Kineosporiaceae bacterium]|nr:ABC transporter permease [Kineosporiaceae bacterium]